MSLRRVIRDNGLSIAFWLMFAAALAGTIAAAIWLGYEEPGSHQPELGSALTSPEFLKGVFGNWQAALLQLLLLIVLARFLRQRGASHSREPSDEAAREALQSRQPGGTGKGAAGGDDGDGGEGDGGEGDGGEGARHPASLIYAHSLSLAFVGLFLAALVPFFLADHAAANQQRAQMHLTALTSEQFAGSARFWFDLLQTWQAECFAMGVFLLLSIFLRERGSPESKKVGATDDDTGDVNE